MDNNTPGSRKLFLLKPAKSGFQSTKSNLSENGNSGNSFNLGNNPFLKKFEDEDTPKNEPVKDPSKSNSSDLKDDLFKPAKKNLNLFTNASALSNNSFVFGQNLHERVVIDKNNSPSIESTTSNDEKLNDESKSSSLLFSSALSSTASKEVVANSDTVDQQNSKEGTTQTVESKDDKDESSPNDNNSMSLVEAARRYEEMKGAQKRKYEEVEVKTGEEDEKNILEMNCKLFTFDKNNWEERGRGMLRLNDSKNSSRVVFRASGSFRVLLNTKVWKDQLCEQPSCKSLRLTAFDTNGLLKIYLVMGKNEDIENLYHYLSTRIQREKDKAPEPDEESQSTQDTADDSDLHELPTKKLATCDE